MLIKGLSRHRAGWKYRRAIPAKLHSITGKKFYVATFPADDADAANAFAAQLAVKYAEKMKELLSLPEDEARIVYEAGGLEGLIRQVEADQEKAAPFFRGLAALDLESEVNLEDEDAIEQLQIARSIRKTAREHDAMFSKRLAIVERFRRKARKGSIGSLLASWHKHSPTTNKNTLKRRESILRDFLRVVGLDWDDPLSKVTRAHVRIWRAYLETRPGRRASRVSKINYLSKLWADAEAQGDTELPNPFVGITLAKSLPGEDPEEDARAWTNAEMRQIIDGLASLTLSKNKRTHVGRFVEFQQITLIYAQHGLRCSEATQLRVQDCADVDGYPALLIRRAAGSIKTPESHRDVPIHKSMVEFVQAIRDEAVAAGRERLFPSFWETYDAYRAYNRWASRYIREKLKLKDPTLVMYGGRHWFRMKLQELKVSPEVSTALTGHALPPQVHWRVYTRTRPEMKLLARAMNKVPAIR